MENFKGINFSTLKKECPNVYDNTKIKLQVKFNRKEDKDFFYSTYEHTETEVEKDNKTNVMTCKNIKNKYEVMIEKLKNKKLGVLIVGIGGNNATTMLGGICANSKDISYIDTYDIKKPNYLGSVFLSSNLRIGYNKKNKEHSYCPIYKLVELYNPEHIIFGGWDINNMNLKDCLYRNKVFGVDFIEKIKNDLDYVPLKSVYFKGNFIADNQQLRVNNILVGTNKLEILEKVRNQIKEFKKQNNLNDVIVLWSGNTEKTIPIIEGVNDTFINILGACKNNHVSVSPSIIYALAAILENCPFINSSPQNTLVNAVVELAEYKNVFIVGNDLKTGQTKIKNFLLDFYFGTGLKPKSIVSYNHLGNNDGKNLSSDLQFYSKKISKSNLICDYVKANDNLYVSDDDMNEKNMRSKHKNIKNNDFCKGDSLISTSTDTVEIEKDCAFTDMLEKQKVNSDIVIKYVPYVGDDKKAMDEYISEIFMNGKNTICLYNICQDSLLASPILIDLILLVELSQRVYFKSLKMNDSNEKILCNGNINIDNYVISHDMVSNKYKNFKRMDSILYLSSLFCKSPFNSSVYKTRHSFFSQLESLLNFIRIICDLPTDAHLDLPFMA
ncbi:inositol-3-phosphate synthase [Hepatocystis sp. ex Piliocolobus tephrosceles]|uniref:Inositol-3-phosphate synthase 1 n=1 Tax=Piliocolobus tephrosceles TaxID=591936 RepID=A0A8C9GWZ8_9PRIM|nr:inositol-3-phosphate synthase [Hepatocystis sp. ex Piliocolobus tephrosceles]